MIRKLNENKNKVPTPDRSDVIRMAIAAWQKITVDCAWAFKTNFVTNSFNGSEDYMDSDKIFYIVGDEMLKFREKLLKT